MTTHRSRLAAAVCCALAATALALPAAPARAAGDPVPTTCHGEDATIIEIGKDDTLAGTPAPGAVVYRGYPEKEPTGTSGRDVVVTSTGYAVPTLGGDDLVCVVGRLASVQAGEGDDTVDLTAVPGPPTAMGYAFAHTDLGPGDDTYTGTVGRDFVVTGPGSDTVVTGAGGDVVDTTGATGGTVDLGDGDDKLLSGGQLALASGGTGTDELSLSLTRAAEAIDVDVPAGTSSVGGLLTPIAGFEGFDVIPHSPADPSIFAYRVEPWSSLRFRGSDAAEVLDLQTAAGLQFTPAPSAAFGPVDVDLGGGADTLVVDEQVHGRFAGGDGPDVDAVTFRRHYDAHRRLVTIDLRRGRFVDNPTVAASRLKGFEAVETSFLPVVEVVGSDRGEAITVGYASSVRVRAGAGPDQVHLRDVFTTRSPRPRVDGGPGRDLVDVKASSGIDAFGGRGDDTLMGGIHHDRLLGGAGHDRVDGGRGRDTCSGESVRRCEG